MTLFFVVFGVCAWFGLVFVALAIASMSKPVPRPLHRSPNVTRIKEEPR